MTSNVISIATRGLWTVRADARQVAEVLGTITNSAGDTVGCLVDDVSLGGARICAAERLCLGERLRLSIPEFEFSAPVAVVWSTDEASGLAFLSC
jgi:hypothetical protein